MKKNLITQDELKSFVYYDEVTGNFYRKKASGTAKIGDIAGWTEPNGYKKISIAGKKYYAHRCAILYVNGEWPSECVDHIDGNKSNNSISNLRCVSHQVNLQNLKKARTDNKSGHLGVCYNKQAKKFVAEIKSSIGERIYLGLFKTKEDASNAYLNAKREIHEGCTI